MRIDKPKLRWPYKPKITLPLLVPVVFNMVHPTHTGTLIAWVAILALAAVKWHEWTHEARR